GIGFLERTPIRVLLKHGVVHAGGRREEVALNPCPVSSFDHMSIDENASQALDSEALDKSHSAHIASQVVNFRSAFAYTLTGFFVAAVEAKVFHFRKTQMPVANGLLVHGTNSCETFIPKILHQVAADDAARTRNGDYGVLLSFRLVSIQPLVLHRLHQQYLCAIEKTRPAP